MNLLIVTRNEATRWWVRAALGPGYPAEDASDGLDALVRARTGGIDLVVADETSEPYGAFGLSRELKLLPDAPSVIVLLERAHDTWLAGWSGADRWLIQPVDPFELAAVAREVLAERGAGAPVAAEDDQSEPVEPVAG